MMAERPVDVVVVGCGGRASGAVSAALKRRPFRLVACVDREVARAESLAAALGGCDAVSELSEALERSSARAALLFSSDAEDGVAQAAADAGLHLWVDQPPTRPAVAAALAARCTAGGRVGQAGLDALFAPNVERVDKLLRDGALGRITSVAAACPLPLLGSDGREGGAPALPAGEGPGREGEASALPALAGARPAAPSPEMWLAALAGPGALLRHFAGPAESIQVRRGGAGAPVILLRFRSGAIGTIFWTTPARGGAHSDRLEIVGQGHRVVLGGEEDLLWYRSYNRTPIHYALIANYFDGDASSSVLWRSRERAAEGPEAAAGRGIEAFLQAVEAGEPAGRAPLEEWAELGRWAEACAGAGEARALID